MSQPEPVRFRLYVAGNAANSRRAAYNLATLCRSYLPDRHEIEVVDILREPQRALADDICMAPTLLMLAPQPGRRLNGTLSEAGVVLAALGLEASGT